MNKQIGRRRFLKLAGLGAGNVGTAVLTHSAASAAGRPSPRAEGHGDVLPQGEVDATTMDHHHEEGVNTFLQNIGTDSDFWRPPLAFAMDGDVKVFQITCQDVPWETNPGTVFPAMAYNGLVPGPEIRVIEGDNVRIEVTNEMAQSTAVHFHGVLVPNSMDGVPFVTQPPIRPGETFTYEFPARNAGTHMYHSHHNAAEQVSSGLLGAFIIEPGDRSREPQVNAEYTLVLNDTTMGFTLNGKSFPYTQPIIATRGDKIRIRYMNEGFMIHPMHLHGIPQLVFAKDGYNLPVPYLCDTLNIAPGERYDVLVDCTELGVWAFHCHILTHAESRNGMFGMVTALAVNE